MKCLLSIVCLTFCLHLTQAQTFLSYARTCKDCNSTANINCDSSPGGVVTCSCKPGYIGDGLNCTAMTYCDKFKCCPGGYTWDPRNKQCADIDECANSMLNKCSPTDTCNNKKGIYLCFANKNVACGSSGQCSQDQDCLKVNGVTQCADPCDNPNIINGTNRLYNRSSPGRFETDRNLFGWYRYEGAGVSLREGCVAPLMCGSMQPFSLGGAHPNIGDGIVSMPLYSNSVSQGCVTGPNILVKACAARYFVYKFSGSLRFDVYCTDVLTPVSTTTTTTTTTITTTTTPTTTTDTPTSTSTSTDTPTSTSTSTDTPTSISTSTDTPTFTSTSTDTSTFTSTSTDTPTFTSTSTDTPTFTSTSTDTSTFTSTSTDTPIPTTTPPPCELLQVLEILKALADGISDTIAQLSQQENTGPCCQCCSE